MTPHSLHSMLDRARRPLLAGAVATSMLGLAAGLLSGPASAVVPDSSSTNRWSSQSATGANLWAVVATDGTVVRSSSGVTVTHTAGSGQYDVTFPRSVADCAANANLGYPGDHEEFTFVSATTVGRTDDPNTIAVDVTYPGDVDGGYPNAPVLRDNAFHLHLQCGTGGRHAVVSPDGTLLSGSPGTSVTHLGTGLYSVAFDKDISACAPVATVSNPADRSALAVQAYLAAGSDSHAVTVGTNRSDLTPLDEGFELTVTCRRHISRVGHVSSFTLRRAPRCGLTAGYFDPHPGATPVTQGYVSTWHVRRQEVVQTKNGGYGVSSGQLLAVVASCHVS